MGVNPDRNKHKTIVFRTDANAMCGAGHLMRCMALAYGFQSEGVRPLFLIDRQTLGFISRRDDFSFDYQIVGNELSELINTQEVIAFVLDGYQFDETYRKHLRSVLSIPIIVIDDCNNSGPLHADVVINPVSQAFKLGYETNAPNTVLLLGPSYTLLRPEFCSADYVDFDNRNTCLVTFGGADVADLTLPVVKYFLAELPELMPLTVVTGGAYQNLDALEKTLSSVMPSITHRHNVTNMAPLLQQARFAISAAGGTVFELAAMGVPTLLIVVADNQLNAALEHQDKGWCEVLDAREGLSYHELVTRVRQLWTNESLLLEMHHKALENAVLNGADRAAQDINKVILR